MRITPTIVASMLAVAVLPGVAAAEERLLLDLHDADTQQTAIATAAPLQAGVDYVISVQGTGSIWRADHWSAPGSICGAPEAGPQIASPGVTNGRVGWDAETVFAVPPGVTFFRSCTPATIPFHVPTRSGGGFKINTGERFFHFEPIGGERTTPRADHTYHYAVKGTGAPAQFAFFDEASEGDRRNDNYGVLSIVVRTAAECATAGCADRAGKEFDATPPPATTAPVSGSSPSVALPPRSCASRRRFTVRLREPRGVNFVRARVTLGDRAFKVVVGRKALRATIDLTGLPRGRFTVQMSVTTSRGQVLRSARRYRTCLKRSESSSSRRPKAS